MKVFSERERKIVKIVGRKKMTINDIVNAFYVPGKTPINADIIIGNNLRTIIKKCRYYKKDWPLTKTRENKKLMIRKTKI